MPGVLKLRTIATILHISLMGATIYLQNWGDATPFYGGATGSLPSTGDGNHPYDWFSAWLSGGGTRLDDPGDQGGIQILGWIISGPLCGMVVIVKALLSLTILHYDVVQLISTDGFGGWFKILIHMVGAYLSISLMSRLVAFAIRAGVFSNVYIMGAIGLVSVLGIAATALNVGGIFSCG